MRVLEAYLADLESGAAPDPGALLAAHADIAEPLRAYLASMEFLRSAALGLRGSIAPNTPAPDTSLPELRQLGDYRILKEIGRGGMGVVYEAEQISLGRRVALKVLPFAGVLDGKQLQRFKNEAHAAAQLHHTNIVPVFSVGCERGVHYYAMQYIDGQSLADAIHELRPLEQNRTGQVTEARSAQAADSSCSGVRTRRITGSGSSAAADLLASKHATGREYFRTIADIGLQAARALAHAHDLGVIHRDVKPSNLLLDARGNLWVTDFGLARIQTDPGLTLTGDLLGTLRYMSPEQALAGPAPLDHRSDIYSLGITLYELLALTPAFDGRDRQDVLRQIAFEEPTALKRLNRAIPSELATIVEKAMAKEPADRYLRMNDLADDLRRFLEDQPIRARPPTLLDRTRKWSRRHRSFVTSVLMLLLLAVAGLSASSFLLWQEQRRTEAAYREAQRQAAHAEQEAAKAAAVNKFLRDMLATVDPAQARGNREITVREALDQAADKIEGGGFTAQPEVEASIRNTIGLTYLGLGHYAEAEPQLRTALQLCRRLFGDDDPDTLYSLNTLGRVLSLQQGKAAEAEACYSEALQRGRRALGDDHQHTLASINYMGYLRLTQGKPADAEPYIREALKGRRRVLGDDHTDTLISINNMGAVLQGQGKLAEAEPYFREALERGRRLVGDDHPDTLIWIINVATVLRLQNKLDEAESYCREAEERCRRVLGDDHPNTLNALMKVADVLRAQGKLAECEPYVREALERSRRVVGDDHDDTLSMINNMGMLLQQQGKLSDAESFFREALERLRRVHGADYAGTMSVLHNLAGLLQAQGKPGEVEVLLIDSYRAMEDDVDVPEGRKRAVLERIVRLYESWEKPEQAAEWRNKLQGINNRGQEPAEVKP